MCAHVDSTDINFGKAWEHSKIHYIGDQAALKRMDACLVCEDETWLEKDYNGVISTDNPGIR